MDKLTPTDWGFLASTYILTIAYTLMFVFSNGV